MKMKEVAVEWLESKKPYIKESTYAYYSLMINKYIVKYWGEEQIEDLSNEKIQETILALQSGTIQETLRVSTLQNIVSILKQCIRHAASMGYAKDMNICIHYGVENTLPKKKVFENDEQLLIVKNAVKHITPKNLGILISVECGLRIGEICALQWQDIDLDRNIIYVHKTLQRVYYHDETPRSRVIVTTPKTKTSIRIIPIPTQIIPYIKKCKNNEGHNYILTNSDKFIEPRTFRKYFKKFLEDIKIENLNFHCLRHSFATRCIARGADVKSVSDILGHATVNTTLNMYVHPGMDEKRKCMELTNIL